MAATSRAGETIVTTPSDREIVMTHVVDAPRTLVFEAHTSVEHVPNWMLGPSGWTMPVCEIDLRPGGAWRFVWRRENGSEMEIRGEYREIEPPARLVQTECWGGDWPESVNTITFEEEDGRTTITSTVVYPSPEARDRALGTGMTDGWSAGYNRLDEYVSRL